MGRSSIKKTVVCSFLFILVALCQHAFAQHVAVNLQRKITMPMGDIRFDSLFHLITRQTGVRFSLNTRKFPPSRIVHINKSTQTLDNVLATIRDKTGIHYTILGGHVIFVDNPPRKVSTAKHLPPLATLKAPASIIRVNDNTSKTANKQSHKVLTVKNNEIIAEKLPTTLTDSLFLLQNKDTIQQVTVKKIDTAHHKVDSVRTKSTNLPLSLGKRNTDTAYYINYSLLSLKGIRLPGFSVGGRNKDATPYEITSTGKRHGFSLQWPNITGPVFSFGGRNRDTIRYETEGDTAKISPPPSTLSSISAQTPVTSTTSTSTTPSKISSATTSTNTRHHTSFLRSAWNGLAKMHLPSIQLPSLQLNGDQERGSRPLFSPVLKAGFTANETFYFNTTLQGGFRFLYGIASWNTNFKTSGFQYGAGIALGVSEDWRLHLTGTTGVMEKPYDTAGFHKLAVSRLSRIGLTAEKQLSDKWSLQFGIAYCILNTRYYINGDLRPPAMDDAAIKKHLSTINPIYTINNNYDLSGAEHNQSWIGFQLGIFYNINFSKRR